MADSEKIKVVVADDHEMVRAGIRRLLADAEDIEVVGEAESGEEAVRHFFTHEPDVLIMDLSMPGMSGLESMRRILQRQPLARIIVLSMREDVVYPKRVIQAGAKGYLTKRTAPEALLRAVREVAKGEVFLEREIAQKVALNGIAGDREVFGELSEREFEVFIMLAEGQTVTAIAKALFLSPKTVGTYQTRIMHKLDVHNAAGLARLAIRNGLIQA
ncbi:MAG: response regulator [Gammaproteobacteria bacterium]|nr:response regulator [Gammaproteobacteria bacterium]